MREGANGQPLSRDLGLVLGLVLFVGILAADRLAHLPGTLRLWLAVGLLAAGGAPLASAALRRRRWLVVAANAAAGGLLLLAAPSLATMPTAARSAAAVTALVATWWITVCIPIPATSLVPLVLFPALGVNTAASTAEVYANNNIFLFMGGFVIALGLQRWGVHRRIALGIIHVVGTNPRRMVLGFMVAAAFLSMWISNTATALMMLPIGLAVADALGDADAPGTGPRNAALGTALMLGLAYGASIGGIATPIGTPPNISCARILGILYPQPVEVPAPTAGVFHFAARPPAWPQVRPGDLLGSIDRGDSPVPVTCGTAGIAIQAPAAEGARVTTGQRLLLIRPPKGPPAQDLAFGPWVMAFLPLTLVFLPLAWLVLVRITCRVPAGAARAGRAVIEAERRQLGRMRPAERRMLAVFVATALLWVFRKDLPIGSLVIPGWSGLLGELLGSGFHPAYLHDATVAIAMALLLFVLPAGARDEHGHAVPLMDWPTAQQLPWGILLLFGGGFAVAQAFQTTGLSTWVGESFRELGITSPLLLVFGTCLLLTFLTEVTSNTATTEVMLPIMAGAAAAIGAHPLLLMLPATISASCAFMLPIATPPNAIVFGSGRVSMAAMVRSGLVLNLLGVALVTVMFLWLARPLLGIDLETLPEWALPPLPAR